MTKKRKIEVFSAGCHVCQDTIDMVKKISCAACEVEILDMHKEDVALRAKELGIKSVPAIVVDGRLAACCSDSGPNEQQLRAAGIGQPL